MNGFLCLLMTSAIDRYTSSTDTLGVGCTPDLQLVSLEFFVQLSKKNLLRNPNNFIIMNHLSQVDLMEVLATRDTDAERLQHEMVRLAANRDKVCRDKL